VLALFPSVGGTLLNVFTAGRKATLVTATVMSVTHVTLRCPSTRGEPGQ
jgi:hypothetical protein